MWGKYCCHFCLCDDQQDPCWLLLTFKDKTGRLCSQTRGKRPKNLPRMGNSFWEATEETLQSDLIWLSYAWGSGAILFYIKLALLWDSALKCPSLGLKAAPVQHCSLFSRAFLSGGITAPTEPRVGNPPLRDTTRGTQQERSLQPVLALSCEKVPVQTGAHSSLQQVEQCLADPSIPGERGGGCGGDSAQRSRELSWSWNPTELRAVSLWFLKDHFHDVKI